MSAMLIILSPSATSRNVTALPYSTDGDSSSTVWSVLPTRWRRTRNRTSPAERMTIGRRWGDPGPAFEPEGKGSLWPRLNVEEHALGVFESLLHLHQELHRLLAVHDAMIVGERDVHHGVD